MIIKLRTPAPHQYPHWQDLIDQPPSPNTPAFIPGIDALLRLYKVPVLVSTEYAPANGLYWSAEEVQAGLDRIYRLVVLENIPLPPGLVPALSALPEVAYARAGTIAHTPLPDRRRSGAQSLTNSSHELIHLKEAQFFGKGRPEIKVAVLDTGIDTGHPEISHAMDGGKDFVNILDGYKEFIGDYLDYDDMPEDEVGHGSHVAGIIASAGRQMPPGIAPGCRIMPIRVLGAMKNGEEVVGAGLVDNINTGIKWAVDNGATVINMSLGIRHEGGGLPHQEVIAYALQKGVSVVAASGNDGTRDKYYPGALNGVIAVGAVDEQDALASFSTYGDHVSFVAPGTNIYSCFKKSKYAFSSGTSQAAPFVSGAIALLKSYALATGHTLSDQQVKYVLKHTCDKPGGALKSEKWGYGRINLVDALKLLDYKLNN